MIEEKDYLIGDMRLHAEVSGSGSPLILMHGWGCDHTTVRSVAATAAKKHKVYNIDFPGSEPLPSLPAYGAWKITPA